MMYCQLMRINKPIGVFLLLWPTLWALWLATPGLPSLHILVIFIIGVWLMRTIGCIINDYVDRKFDSYIKRTADRPLITGVITNKEVIILSIILLTISFLLVLTTNIETILLSFIALILTWIYPFMKRYTYIPQLVLGITFSWSILMAFAAVGKLISLNCWLTFLANILWTISYDTQYAMVDRDDDLKVGIKSTAILFGYNDKLIIGILQISVLAIMIAIGYFNIFNWKFYLAVFTAGLLFIYQQKLIINRESKLCFKAFMNNNYVGMILFLGIAIS